MRLAPHRTFAVAPRTTYVDNGIANSDICLTVTFLSVLASNGIALPLSGSFPAGELRYILNQSQAAMFLYSQKMLEKANEVTQEGLEARPTLGTVETTEKSASSYGKVTLEDQEEDNAALMLYTSGTTSRPVGHFHTIYARRVKS